MPRSIPLTRGYVATVDDEDYERLAAFKWCALVNPRGYVYAVRFTRIPKPRLIRMHRVVVDAPSSSLVDHRNHDGLDNRKSNLRICTRAENTRNQRKHRGTKTSRFKGVSRSRAGWRAYVAVDSTVISLGSYSEEESAARAYDRAAQRLHGEFALLNGGAPCGA